MGTEGGAAARRELSFDRGASVGRYVVIERLGAGAMGVVYKAFDPDLDRVVAIKLLLGDGSSSGSQGASRLQREAQAMARIAHPNVIAVHDVGTVADRVFFAMELVDGVPLSTWLKRENPTESEILEVFRRAGAGIAAAHAAGVIHRDFKPDNVLVDGQGRPRVLDFGLARQGAERAGDSGATPQSASSASFDIQLTRTGAVMGTPAYMAPEQFAGQPSDERTDQFAFCVALHEALTGERPFRADSFATLSAAVVRGNRAETPGAADLDPAILAVLDRGLQTSPGARFDSMTALLDALSPVERFPAGLALVGVAVLATATAAAYGLGRKSAAPPVEPQPCADAGAEMDTLWTEAQRRSVLSAFENSGAFNGASMGARVVKVLDNHASAWTAAAGRSCARAGHEHMFTETLAFRSGVCLDARLSDFKRTIEAFGTVNADAVQTSLSSAERLREPDTCTDVSRLELMVGSPLDPDLRARLSGLTPRVSRASHAWGDGDAHDCLKQLSAVESEVYELGFGPEIARMLAIRAQCEHGAGKVGKAARTRERTFEAALASADDITAMKVASTIAHVFATTTDDFETAENWIRRAEALSERHSLRSTEHIAPLLNVRGILASRQHRPEAAAEYFEQVATLARDDPSGAEAFIAGKLNVGVVLANLQRFEEATKVFQECVDFAREHWGPRHKKTAGAQTQLAQVLTIQGRFVEARTVHMQALKGLRAATDEPQLSHAYAIFSLGLVEHNLDDLAAAETLYEEAYQIRAKYDALGTSEAAPLFNAKGRLALGKDDFAEAERWFRRAVDVRAESPALVRAESLALLARARIHQGDKAGARALTQDAEALALSGTGEEPSSSQGLTLYSVATNWSELGHRSRALELFEQAERVSKGKSYEVRDGPYRLNYARALRDAGEPGRARAVVQAVLDRLADSPYPKVLVADAQALRDELGP